MSKIFVSFFICLCSLANSQVFNENYDFLKSDYEGTEKYFVFKFFASWCIPCIAETADYNDFAKSIAGDSIEFITISAEKDSVKVKQILARYNMFGSWAIDKDRLMHKQLQVEFIPDYVLVDKEGNVALHGMLEELILFLEKGQLFEHPKDFFPEKFTFEDDISFQMQTGRKTKKKFGACEIQVNEKGIGLKFNNYSALTLIGFQIQNFSLPRILSDTNDFTIDLRVEDTVLTQQEAMRRAGLFLQGALDYRVDTVMLYKEVWEVITLPKVDTLPVLHSGWAMGRDSIRYVSSNLNTIKAMIENTWGCLIEMPSNTENSTLTFNVEYDKLWEEQIENFEKAGVSFKSKVMATPHLSLQFSKKPKPWSNAYSR